MSQTKWGLIMRGNAKLQTLRQKVYEYLKLQIANGTLKPGEFLDLKTIESEMGMSRTPLRDALFQLEVEGFVTIYPRKGVMLNSLDLKTIRNIYEIVGALESSVLINAAMKITEEDVVRMSELNDRMRRSLDRDDYENYYEANVQFHNVFLDLSDNDQLLVTSRVMRDRLYDFQSRGFLKEWEESNLREHREMVRLLEVGNFNGTAEYLRDVHWAFPVQERFIRKYYFTVNGRGAPSRQA